MTATINHNTEDRRITLSVRKERHGGHFWWPDEHETPSHSAGTAFARLADAEAVARRVWGDPRFNIQFLPAGADDA